MLWHLFRTRQGLQSSGRIRPSQETNIFLLILGGSGATSISSPAATIHGYEHGIYMTIYLPLNDET